MQRFNFNFKNFTRRLNEAHKNPWRAGCAKVTDVAGRESPSFGKFKAMQGHRVTGRPGACRQSWAHGMAWTGHACLDRLRPCLDPRIKIPKFLGCN